MTCVGTSWSGSDYLRVFAAVYVVGQHPNSAKNPHSAPASGGNNIKAVSSALEVGGIYANRSFQINTDPAQMAYTLYGALIGGPNAADEFYDLRDGESAFEMDWTADSFYEFRLSRDRGRPGLQRTSVVTDCVAGTYLRDAASDNLLIVSASTDHDKRKRPLLYLPPSGNVHRNDGHSL